VSVVIPARDAEAYIAEAIESALSQEPPPLEVVVVDDGSGDRTATIAEGYGDAVRVYRQEPAGPAAARNRGLAETHAGLVAFLDADDVWTAGALAPRVEALHSDTQLDIVFGHVSHFGSAADGTPGLLPGHLIGAMLARRRAFTRVGRLREDLAGGEFVDWLARARELGLAERMLDAHVLRRRVHDRNLGVVNGAAARADLVGVVKDALDRRRAGGELPS
jgi:glycosyltransferase involved in cell wall biosynthesis